MNTSKIEHTQGGTVFSGPDAVAVYRATVVARGLDFYADHKMLVNRMYTPKNMMAVAMDITGQKFPARAYKAAAAALRKWAQEKRAAIPEVKVSA